MKVKADDYFNNGIFEVARFGKINMIKNVMTPEQHRHYVERLKSDYTCLKEKINAQISIIRDKVTHCNPVQLLSFSADMFLMSLFGIQSEIQISKQDIPTARMTEYIQSILVSSPNYFIKDDEVSDPSEMFYSIQTNTKT